VAPGPKGIWLKAREKVSILVGGVLLFGFCGCAVIESPLFPSPTPTPTVGPPRYETPVSESRGTTPLDVEWLFGSAGPEGMMISVKTAPFQKCRLNFIAPGQTSGDLPSLEEDRIADESGRASWNWDADPLSQRGQGRVVVICGDTKEELIVVVIDSTPTPH
jgi:hypothetical protein